MIKYECVIKKRSGVVTKIIEAKNEQQASVFAKKEGKLVTIKKKRASFIPETGMSIPERQIFLQRLGAMLKSKVGAGEALALMEATFNGSIKKAAGKLLKQVENGCDIGEGMRNIGLPDFPRTLVALVQSGSVGSNTATALTNAAEFESEIERVKKASGKGIMSGFIGFVFAVISTFATTRGFGPQVLESDLVKIAGDQIDVDWAITLGMVSEWFMGFFSLVFLCLYLLSSVGRRIMPAPSDRIILKIPFYKDLILARNNYTTLFSMGLLVKSGVPMEKTLALSIESTDKGQMQEDLKKSLELLRKGKPWANGMINLHPTDRAALGTSQDKEAIGVTLDALSSQYKSLYAARVEFLAPIIQTISMIFLVISGGVLFGQAIVPLLQFASAKIV
jgi:general secretion pathway protein F